MLEKLCALMLVLLVGVVAIGVLDRFLLGLGLAWTEELARFILVWLSMLAAVYAMKSEAHFRIRVLISQVGALYARAVSFVCIALCLITAWFGAQLALKFHIQTSPALGLPMSVVYASVPVAFLGMALFLAFDLFAAVPAALRNGDAESGEKDRPR